MKIGFTSTVPMEVIFAAGHIPVDLNNIFITSDNAGDWVNKAELKGFPRNICSWIKGLYIAGLKENLVDQVIAVTEGDCSNTKVLMEILKDDGRETIPFAYPSNHIFDSVKKTIDSFCDELKVSLEEVTKMKLKLDQVREIAWKIDDLTWRENKVSGEENHYYLVNCSDFMGDWKHYGKILDDFYKQALRRERRKEKIRLAFLGVPPVFSDLYEQVNEYGGNVVFNEIQRQFSMPFPGTDIYQQYYLYTYPYSSEWRLQDVVKECQRRNIHGIIHYAQAFCHRQLEDILIRRKVFCPVLTIEGDSPGRVDERTKIRLQSFIEMLKEKYDLRN